MKIESLERRSYLSFTGSYDAGSKTVTITGTAVVDNIVVTFYNYPESFYKNINFYESATETAYSVYIGTNPVSKIVVNLFDGSDSLSIGTDSFTGTSPTNFPFNIQVNGGKGNDTVKTGAGQDYLTGGEGNDSLDAGAGNDSVDGSGGTDQIAGGAGVDWCINTSRTTPLNLTLDGIANDGATGENDNIQSSIENIAGGQSNDTITGNSAGNFLTGGGGNDQLRGLDGNDILYGNGGKDSMYGGPGDDQFFAIEPGEVDSMNGGAGFDMASRDGPAIGEVFNQFQKSSSLSKTSSFASLGPGAVEDVVDDDIEIETNGPDLIVNTTTGNDTILLTQSGSNMTFTRNGVSVTRSVNGVTRVGVAGGMGNDTIKANTSVVVPLLLNGNEGNDSIDGGSGADTIRGFTGNDSLFGGIGADAIFGGTGADRLTGGSDNDTLYGEVGNDTLISGAGNDLFDGGADLDTIDFSLSVSGQRVSLDNVANDGSASTGEADNVLDTIENILGGMGNDTLTGSAYANAINGNGGNDSISGLAGNDTLTGGAGRDILFGGDNADTFFTLDGEIDTIRGGNGADQDGATDEFDDAIF